MIGSGEYIGRDAAIEAMYKDAEANPNHTFWTSQFEALMDIPAADVRPVVRGKWEYNGPDENVPYCSNCMLPSDEETRFCAGCGADMRGESDV